MGRKKPLIALITDFGTRDHYVGTMKGVIARFNPHQPVVDISHEIQPQHVQEGAYLLWASYRYFPERTVFVCVVDPGVGTDRNILIVQSDRYSFIAPDNGLLDLVTQSEETLRSFALPSTVDLHQTNPRFFPFPISRSFHGRDVFAPLGAHLARGFRPERFAPPCPLPNHRFRFIRLTEKARQATILHVDRFGNIVTNVLAPDGPEKETGLRGFVLGRSRVVRQIPTFDAAPDRRPCYMVGSSGLYEIVVKGGNAARLLKATLDTKMKILLR